MKTDDAKLLAQFLEANNEKYEKYGIMTSINPNGAFTPLNDMPFDTDLNWLIAVVRKIRDVIHTEFTMEHTEMFKGWEHSLNPFNRSNEAILITSIEFVKWYNFHYKN